VGHVERFNPVVRWFSANLDADQILSINITRVGPRPPRIKDVGIIVDLAVHDIDLVEHLCQSPIIEIQSVHSSTFGQHEDVAQINMKTQSGTVCAVNTNWLTPYKSRKIEIATRGAFYSADLILGTITRYQSVDQNGQDFVVQQHKPAGLEPLVEQALGFVQSLRGEASPNATIQQACRVVELSVRCLKGTC
jgi:predicted dehydrogenase